MSIGPLPISQYPRIGIRPTIDGRRGGVREALEDSTLALARAVADLLKSRLRYADGAPVECIIPDSCIGGLAEAAATEKLFATNDVGLSITVTPCWCYGTETMDMHPTRPKAIFGFNGTERPGAVYLAATLSAHNQKGLPCFGVYGRDVQDMGDTSIPENVRDKILRFARAGLAVAQLQGTAYLGMGSVSMGIVGSKVNDDFFEKYLGMRVESVDMTEFTRRIDRKIYDEEEFERALAWVKGNCKEGKDYNPPAFQQSRETLDQQWRFCVKTALIARDLMVGNPRLAEFGFAEEALGHHAIAGGFQGQRQWTDHFPNGDFLEAILATSFDWNGIRQPFMVATENDSMNGASMLLPHLLTHSAQVFADVRTYWSPDAVKRVTGHSLTGDAESGLLHLINSGPAALDGTGEQTVGGRPAIKPHYDITEEDAKACLAATTWHPAMGEYFRGGGFSTRWRTRGGIPITMCRFNLIGGLGPSLQIAEGWSVELPDAVHDALDQRTNPTWPTTWFVPRTGGNGTFRDVYSVMNAWGANHGSFTYGHIGADLITLASMLRIPVSLHNVPVEHIYRPSAWGHFGADDPIGADYRACAAYGPLYG